MDVDLPIVSEDKKTPELIWQVSLIFFWNEKDMPS